MISVVIPTYKNPQQLVKNLRTNMRFLNGSEIIVVNDYPKESIKKELSPFAEVHLIENKTNLGFAGAVHTGIQASTQSHILLLNSDVVLEDSSFMKAVDQMNQDNEIFAVSFCQKEKNDVLVGKNSIYWKGGFFRHKKADNLSPGINGWAEGGSCLIDRKKYEQIGGFDSLYSPFYWEDIDLSYRAWKMGYKIEFNPSIIVEHHHESTIGKYFDRDRIYMTAYRNQFIFIWKNINNRGLIISHLFSLAKTTPIMMVKDKAFVRGLWQAVKRLPSIIKKRKQYPLSDRDILKKFI